MDLPPLLSFPKKPWEVVDLQDGTLLLSVGVKVDRWSLKTGQKIWAMQPGGIDEDSRFAALYCTPRRANAVAVFSHAAFTFAPRQLARPISKLLLNYPNGSTAREVGMVKGIECLVLAENDGHVRAYDTSRGGLKHVLRNPHSACVFEMKLFFGRIALHSYSRISVWDLARGLCLWCMDNPGVNWWGPSDVDFLDAQTLVVWGKRGAFLLPLQTFSKPASFQTLTYRSVRRFHRWHSLCVFDAETDGVSLTTRTGRVCFRHQGKNSILGTTAQGAVVQQDKGLALLPLPLPSLVLACLTHLPIPHPSHDPSSEEWRLECLDGKSFFLPV